MVAYKNGGNIEARTHMMSAAAMGATAFQKGRGPALSHPIGAVYGTQHGMTNAIALPAVVKFNRPAIEARVELLAAYLGIEGGFDGFYAWLIDFSRALGVPEKMSTLGVDRDQIDLLAKMAVEDPSAGGNPIPLNTEITKKLYEEIL
ncbi:iron-containing alcohol dehydrogenase [Thalassospira povalilytica]|uniref:Iron-containing alcohol dehydrogenase n=2 Tax=Thalassospira povalilytica TaxID=732237 RepID=A0A8I1MBA9_9PROT|nr:iron-containing alcohol dehydrogenase [Thalassospira povalilytica]